MMESRDLKEPVQISMCGQTARGDRITLGDFFSGIYLPHVKLRKRSWRIDERVGRRHICPWFANRPIARIDRREVEDWLNSLRQKGYAPASCNRFLAVFKTVCALAEKRCQLGPGQSPCAGVNPFKIGAGRERYLSVGEAARLMRALSASQRPEARIIQLLLLTGARKSEILKSRWGDLNAELRILTVPVSKSGRPRQIVLSDAALAVIGAIPRLPGCKWLFPGHDREKPLSDVYLFWNKLRRELGLADVRIHDLRHTFASFLVNAGHSLYAVQKMLGHADPRTTMRYAHLGSAPLLAAADMVGALLAGRGKRGRTTPRPAKVAAQWRDNGDPAAARKADKRRSGIVRYTDNLGAASPAT